jgi:hypothetical protein
MTTNKPRYAIGIDPGVKTGMAVWFRPNQKFIYIKTLSLPEVFEIILTCYDQGDAELFIEDARQRKWFGTKGREALQGAGSIKRDCSIWQEFCEFHHIKYTMISPQKGGTKLSADMFAEITGYTGRTSQHARDAALIVFKG